MNSKHDIRILTERFFNGETTIEEEKALYRLYQGDDVPQDLLVYREFQPEHFLLVVNDARYGGHRRGRESWGGESWGQVA